ncbi:hypothetical protein MmTuc01_3238 [Methanosarcina mazei Tuc01]|uniref:Uncharacterized protein n=1 Tax=Methanosarcina mazei Tuc01 TaxID=1236903 RepID=M1Q850_METMZ|nr:hypothetical protein [Methanosarcina mazei]AGF98495.1 hypothetical protein MmTuc01_3238 [Methanosarcina mazei Tuc01]
MENKLPEGWAQVNLKTFFGVEGYFLTFKPMKSGFSGIFEGDVGESL